ncbi:hypothetical protein ACFOQM_12410 [Paenibacillus sp. GCM10012307]|uniref:Uncharacterized protein n=1 Tax=Paenibacillus roseus TaxID=2798579 RepID=A0A934MR83_9BACL|nr:hypothetical protein [Paenibacillus roseus]MBJ6362094.1 hypothetical protein [Paenibacillus roseus]
MTDKEIAKEIILAMIEHKYLLRSEYPQVKTVSEMVGLAYNEILTALQDE